MEGRLGSLEQVLQQNQTRMAEMQAQNQAQITEMQANLLAMKDMIAALAGNGGGNGNRNVNDGPRINNGEGNPRNFNFTPKVEFPVFDGSNPRMWIKKCNRYFDLCKISDSQKVNMASLYMTGKAESWVHSFLSVRPNIEWEDFKMDLCARFKENLGSNVVEEFNKLQQTGSLEDYLDSFENLRGLMLQRNALLPESYFLDSFIAGLKAAVKPFVRALKPATLSDAVELARCQEESLSAARNLSKPVLDKPPVRFNGQNVGYNRNQNAVYQNNSNTKFVQPFQRTNPLPANPRANPNYKKLSPAEIEEKRRKNLCFQCDEPYTPGHKCKGRLYHMVLVPQEADNEGEMEEEDLIEYEYDMPETMEGTNEDQPLISLNAIAGHTSYQTMRVQGRVKENAVHVLIDSGSTHNFCDESTAKRLGCKITKTYPLEVSVANGEKLITTKVCKGFKWRLHGVEFQTDVMIVPLGGCEMVLGVQWLSSLGPVIWDFEQLKMEFMYKGRKVTLRGITKGGLQWISGKKLVADMEKGDKFSLGQLFAVNVHPTAASGLTEARQADIPDEISKVLEEFPDIFTEPKELPPHRSHDHQIHLHPGTPPINVRPYRYPVIQKNAIEQITREMLDAGVVRQSQSPFSSPIVMVKKKDGTWRFCVDYRELNRHTVKDKFPIPVIDELLDELHGSGVYSKIDLRSGYWQIRMKQEDIQKTAFRTHEGHYEFVVMPFGLTNAPSTFQSLMNNIFSKFLRKFILVFFDDILVYSPDITTHVQHLKQTLSVLRQHQLFAKMSKCEFGVGRVEYLGHIVSSKGVATDPEKIKAMVRWPTPKNVKELRGFLGLTGYYRKFIKGYGIISKPLTNLLRKNAFIWNTDADAAFESLKSAMSNAPVLALPDFKSQFEIETDASDIGIGAVLAQNNHPIAFISKALSQKHKALSTYEKELLAVVLAVEKWRPYLVGNHFVIKTDHFSLKYLLGQKITNAFQSKCLPKLLGLDCEVLYRKGKENTVADALSRVQGAELLSLLVTQIRTDLMRRIRNSWENSEVKELIADLQAGKLPDSKFKWQNNQLLKKGRLVIGPDENLRSEICSLMHNSSLGGHSGVHATYERMHKLFYWKNMKKDIRNWVRICVVCQQNKAILKSPAGLLQPLPIPDTIWTDISMDFIEGLPKSQGKDTILVVVDRLSKMAHFLLLTHPYKASDVAKVFLDQVFRLHGNPKTIVSDRDKVFLSQFWQELFKLQKIDLLTSTAYHPQTDGQSEVVNKCLEGYLRCMAGEKPKDWAQWIPLAEWWYNTNHHSAIKTTPFEVVYGQPPPLHVPYVSGDSPVAEVDRSLRAREECISMLKFHLQRAQDRMKMQSDRRRSDVEFEEGDLVYVKLQPYRQHSVVYRHCQKLAPKYFGPFSVLKRVGRVSYKVLLPAHSKVHPVFHVSLLKKHHGPAPVTSVVPELDDNLQLKAEPVAILERKMAKKGNVAVVYFLVQWSNGNAEDATWELSTDFMKRWPDFPV